MKRILLALLLLPATAFAQDLSGYQRLGEALSGAGRQEAYERGMYDALEREVLIQQIRAAQADERIRDYEATSKDVLTHWWVAYGLNANEAEQVASTFRLTEEQPAINLRAEREGFAETVRAGIRAYDDHRYLLANQLLIAAERIYPPDAKP